MTNPRCSSGQKKMRVKLGLKGLFCRLAGFWQRDYAVFVQNSLGMRLI
jgi:hypothetical protein